MDHPKQLLHSVTSPPTLSSAHRSSCKRADINVIDFGRLRLRAPEIVHDLPAGGKRLVQRVEGYEATLVAGTPVFERGEHTGAKPGRLVRRGR